MLGRHEYDHNHKVNILSDGEHISTVTKERNKLEQMSNGKLDLEISTNTKVKLQ
jgi:hypothetical protein